MASPSLLLLRTALPAVPRMCDGKPQTVAHLLCRPSPVGMQPTMPTLQENKQMLFTFLQNCFAAHDAYLVHENKVQHWNSVTRRVTTVMDVSGEQAAGRVSKQRAG